jgi:hypothetical protein
VAPHQAANGWAQSHDEENRTMSEALTEHFLTARSRLQIKTSIAMTLVVRQNASDSRGCDTTLNSPRARTRLGGILA